MHELGVFHKSSREGSQAKRLGCAFDSLILDGGGSQLAQSHRLGVINKALTSTAATPGVLARSTSFGPYVSFLRNGVGSKHIFLKTSPTSRAIPNDLFYPGQPPPTQGHPDPTKRLNFYVLHQSGRAGLRKAPHPRSYAAFAIPADKPHCGRGLPSPWNVLSRAGC